MIIDDSPEGVGTRIFAPKTASGIVIGTSQYKLSPRRSKKRMLLYPGNYIKIARFSSIFSGMAFSRHTNLGAIICSGRNFDRNPVSLLLGPFSLTEMTGMTIHLTASVTLLTGLRNPDIQKARCPFDLSRSLTIWACFQFIARLSFFASTMRAGDGMLKHDLCIQSMKHILKTQIDRILNILSFHRFLRRRCLLVSSKKTTQTDDLNPPHQIPWFY